jgi:hypothetical protein
VRSLRPAGQGSAEPRRVRLRYPSMKNPPPRLTLKALLTATASHLVAGASLPAQSPPEPLRADFSHGARLWQDVKLADRANRFSVLEEGGRSILRAESDRSASALWHGLNVSPDARSRVRWRWRVESALSRNVDERSKKGDDYAARFFVIFDAEPFSRRGA